MAKKLEEDRERLEIEQSIQKALAAEKAKSETVKSVTTNEAVETKKTEPILTSSMQKPSPKKPTVARGRKNLVANTDLTKVSVSSSSSTSPGTKRKRAPRSARSQSRSRTNVSVPASVQPIVQVSGTETVAPNVENVSTEKPLVENQSEESTMEDVSVLKTTNMRYRDQIAQLQTELEHVNRVLQTNMGRSPIIPNRFCQPEVENLLQHYDSIHKMILDQLMKIEPTHPKYAWYESAYHLNTEIGRLVRDVFSYRGFAVSS